MLTLFLLSLFTLFIATSSEPAQAQESSNQRRIGFLSSGFFPLHYSSFTAFHQGLHDFGYVEGRNVSIEYRYGNGRRQPERLPELAEELIRLKVNVIFAQDSASLVAAKRSTSKLPIVTLFGPDPVPRLIESLARPGGNITGIVFGANLSGKLLQLIVEAVPEATRVGTLRHPLTPVASLTEAKSAARSLRRELEIVETHSLDEFDKAMAELSERRVGAVVVLSSLAFILNQPLLAKVAIKYRLPTIFYRSQFADAGGLMTYGPRSSDLWRRAGVLVGKILNGASQRAFPSNGR